MSASGPFTHAAHLQRREKELAGRERKELDALHTVRRGRCQQQHPARMRDSAGDSARLRQGLRHAEMRGGRRGAGTSAAGSELPRREQSDVPTEKQPRRSGRTLYADVLRRESRLRRRCKTAETWQARLRDDGRLEEDDEVAGEGEAGQDGDARGEAADEDALAELLQVIPHLRARNTSW